MKVSDSSIISESPKQQINKWMEPGPGHRKNILGCELVAVVASSPHIAPLSLSTTCTHSLFIIPPQVPGRGCCGAVGLDNNNNHTIIPDRPSFAASAQGVQRTPFSCIPSQPSHFKDELIIHHTPNILSVEKPGRNNKTIVAMVKLKQCWQQLA